MGAYQNVFICSPVEGHLGCFQFLVIMNNVAINICVQSIHEHQFLILLGEDLGVGLLSCMRKCKTTSKLGMRMGRRENYNKDEQGKKKLTVVSGMKQA